MCVYVSPYVRVYVFTYVLVYVVCMLSARLFPYICLCIMPDEDLLYNNNIYPTGCTFLYIGHYQLTSDGYSTSIKTLSLEDCLLSCISSSTCVVASYDGKLKCQHSTSEAVAGHKRTLSPGWSQYIVQNCSQITSQGNIPVFYICLGVMSVVIVIFICTTIFVTIHYRKKLSHLMTRNVSSQNFDDLNRNVQGVFFSANNSANDELRGRVNKKVYCNVIWLMAYFCPFLGQLSGS